MTSARVRLWDQFGLGRGPGNLVAIIDDAANVGVSSVANGAGTCHFTLPYNHPQISLCVPLLRHYSIERVAADGTVTTVGVGLLTDYDSTENEVIFYGTDYLGLFLHTITAANTTYTTQTIGAMISAQIAAAQAEPNSRVAFLTVGTIDATTLSPASILTSYEPRLLFLQSLISTWAGSNATPVRPLLSISRASPFTISFSQSTGVDRTQPLLEWGGTVNHFRYMPGWAHVSTRVNSIGQKRDGATVLYSTQTNTLSEATYGWIATNSLHIDVVDQTTLDNLVKHDARVAGRIGKNIGLTIISGAVAPWDGYDLLDSLPVSISRGPVSLSKALYTIGSLEWTCLPDGSEQTVIGLFPKDV